MARQIPVLAEEEALLDEFFRGALKVKELSLYEGGVYSLGSTRTIGASIYFEPKLRFEELRRTPAGRSLLVHESAHVWQYQQVGPRYAVGSLWDQLRFTLLTGSRRGAYLYRLAPERPLRSYGYEQQAQILQDYFLRRWHGDDYSMRLHCQDFGEIGKARALSIAERLWREVAEVAS